MSCGVRAVMDEPLCMSCRVLVSMKPEVKDSPKICQTITNCGKMTWINDHSKPSKPQTLVIKIASHTYPKGYLYIKPVNLMTYNTIN